MLESNGITVESPDKHGRFDIRAVLLFGTRDLPAKACVCNVVQYSGLFGCFKCLQPGCTVKVGNKGGHVHAFPLTETKSKDPQEHMISVLLMLKPRSRKENR